MFYSGFEKYKDDIMNILLFDFQMCLDRQLQMSRFGAMPKLGTLCILLFSRMKMSPLNIFILSKEMAIFYYKL